MSIIDTDINQNEGALLCSYKCDGGGNQSGKKLSEMLGYKFYHLNTEEWKECKAKKQIWYMNDDIYKLNSECRMEFENVLSYADDIKIVLNFVIGGTDKQSWLYQYPVSKVIFLNKQRTREWQDKTKNTRQGMIPVETLVPPINIERFEDIRRTGSDKIRIGRHSRIYGKFPDDPVSMYKKLNISSREFYFMLGHPKLKKEFKNEPNFFFYEWSQEPVHEYLASIDIYLAIINPKTKEQAGRSNMEAMAAGCCVITENRDGPVDYIEHGKTGFLVNNEQEAIDIINSLEKEDIRQIGENAREYALTNFNPNKWINTLS